MILDNKGFPGWKRFYAFVALLLVIFFGLLIVFSNNFLIKEIQFSSYYVINDKVENDFIGSSIHLMSRDQIIDRYSEDPNIEMVSVNKVYPNRVEIIIEHYRTLALITDFRTEKPIYYRLYKNGTISKIPPEKVLKEVLEANTIEIVNGPVQDNAYGEFVNYFLLLRNADSSIITSFSLNSGSLTGKIGEISIDFVSPQNLGKKASAVYQRLKEPCPSSSFTVDADNLTGNVVVICNI